MLLLPFLWHFLFPTYTLHNLLHHGLVENVNSPNFSKYKIIINLALNQNGKHFDWNLCLLV